jgi:hypothetical protein
MNTCDVENCGYTDDAIVDTDSGIPEGWSEVTIPDVSGEHQVHLVCPAHRENLWAFIANESENSIPTIPHHNPPILWFADQGIYSGNQITEDMVHMADVIIHNNVVIKNRFGRIDVSITNEAINDLRGVSLATQKEVFTAI